MTLIVMNGFCLAPDENYILKTFYLSHSDIDILSLQTGVTDIVSCLSQCRAAGDCLSVNYETGLCVLFNSSATKLSGLSLIFHKERKKLLKHIWRREGDTLH